MGNLKFFYRACIFIFVFLCFIFTPFSYYNHVKEQKVFHVTTGEVIKSEKVYTPTGHYNWTGYVTIKFYNRVQEKEMTRKGVIDVDDVSNYKPGQKLEIGYTEGFKVLTSDDRFLVLEPSKRQPIQQTMMVMLGTGIFFLIIGMILRIIYFRKLKV